MKINGEMHYLWRAVDHEGEVWMRWPRKAGQGRGKEIPGSSQHGHRWASGIFGGDERDRCCCRGRSALGSTIGRELHQPFRRRERAMQRFRSLKTLQKFSSVHAHVHNQFNQERHLVTRQIYKQRRSAALAEWRALAA